MEHHSVYQSESESKCKCLTCNQKPTESSLVYCTNQTKRLMGKKLKRKSFSSPLSMKAVQWQEKFKEKVSFEFRVEKSRSDGQ